MVVGADLLEQVDGDAPHEDFSDFREVLLHLSLAVVLRIRNENGALKLTCSRSSSETRPWSTTGFTSSSIELKKRKKLLCSAIMNSKSKSGSFCSNENKTPSNETEVP